MGDIKNKDSIIDNDTWSIVGVMQLQKETSWTYVEILHKLIKYAVVSCTCLTTTFLYMCIYFRSSTLIDH